MSGPHVVVDARLATAAGHRTYIRNIVPRVAHLRPDWRWTLLGDARALASEQWARGGNVSLQHFGAPVYGIREQLELAAKTPADAALFWSMHYNIPLLSRAPVVATIHDAAHLRLPEYRAQRLRHAYARLMFSAVVSRTAALILNSEFTKCEVAELAGDSRGSTTVIHMGVDESWFAAPTVDSPVQPPFFVFIGNLKPHKNVRVLLAAMRALDGTLPERLVIVGRTGDQLRTPDRAALDEIAALGDRAVIAGEVGDRELRALVASATAVVMPSLYEGFGFPPLEAMAAGCAVIASRAASLPEICSDVPLYFEARDAAGLAAAMSRLSNEVALRRDRGERGRVHARRFSWDDTAYRTVTVLERVIARSIAASTRGRT